MFAGITDERSDVCTSSRFFFISTIPVILIRICNKVLLVATEYFMMLSDESLTIEKNKCGIGCWVFVTALVCITMYR